LAQRAVSLVTLIPYRKPRCDLSHAVCEAARFNRGRFSSHVCIAIAIFFAASSCANRRCLQPPWHAPCLKKSWKLQVSLRREFAMSATSWQQQDYFQEAFQPEERQELLNEDTAAFSGVTGILMFVIGVGVVLAAFSLLIILAMS
jgi:hypothetical protein